MAVITKDTFQTSIEAVSSKYETSLKTIPKVWPKELGGLVPLFTDVLQQMRLNGDLMKDKLNDLLSTITEIIKSEDDLRKQLEEFKSKVVLVYIQDLNLINEMRQKHRQKFVQ